MDRTVSQDPERALKEEAEPWDIYLYKEVQAMAEIIMITHSVPMGRKCKIGKQDRDSPTEIGSSAASLWHPTPRKDQDEGKQRPRNEPKAWQAQLEHTCMKENQK